MPKQPATEETSMVTAAVMVSASASCGLMPGMDEISPSCSHREGNHITFMHSGVESWLGARALAIGVRKGSAAHIEEERQPAAKCAASERRRALRTGDICVVGLRGGERLRRAGFSFSQLITCSNRLERPVHFLGHTYDARTRHVGGEKGAGYAGGPRISRRQVAQHRKTYQLAVVPRSPNRSSLRW